MSKVIVAGSINMDIVAFVEKHPKVGETIFGTNLKYFPGGKGANQAVSSAKLGADTTIIGKVGQDGFGQELTQFLKQQNIALKVNTTPDAPTGTAFITVSTTTSNNSIIVISGANFELKPADIDASLIKKGDILVSQFEIPTETIQEFFKHGKQNGAITVFNPAPAKLLSNELMSLIDILILNETELEFICGTSVDPFDDSALVAAIKKIRIGSQTILVTLGTKGVAGYIDGSLLRISGYPVTAVDTTGAGDCFVGALAAHLSKGHSLTEAIKFGNKAASICVTREGAGPSMPSAHEITESDLNG
jgi:ribokinase